MPLGPSNPIRHYRIMSAIGTVQANYLYYTNKHPIYIYSADMQEKHFNLELSLSLIKTSTMALKDPH